MMLITYIISLTLSDCCTYVTVKYKDNATFVRDKHPEIFTTYRKELTVDNERPYYISHDRKWNLAFRDCGFWAITNDTHRYWLDFGS